MRVANLRGSCFKNSSLKGACLAGADLEVKFINNLPFCCKNKVVCNDLFPLLAASICHVNQLKLKRVNDFVVWLTWLIFRSNVVRLGVHRS